MEGFWLVSYLVLWIGFVVLGVAVICLLRQVGLYYLRSADALSRDGLALASLAPRFTAEALNGRAYSVGGEGPPTLLVFGTPSCPSCRLLVPDLNTFAKDHATWLRVLYVSGGQIESASEFVKQTGIEVPVLSGGGTTLPGAYGVRATPFAYFIDSASVVRGKGITASKEALVRLALKEGAITPGTKAPSLITEVGILSDDG